MINLKSRRGRLKKIKNLALITISDDFYRTFKFMLPDFLVEHFEVSSPEKVIKD